MLLGIKIHKIEINKSWIDLRRINPRAYVQEIRMFLNFAYRNKNKDEFFYFPCIKCANRYYHGKDTVNEHLILDGFLTSYKK
ncbi:Transpos_assoc domain-containing protein, partial [Cephalotus follicularis]